MLKQLGGHLDCLSEIEKGPEELAKILRAGLTPEVLSHLGDGGVRIQDLKETWPTKDKHFKPGVYAIIYETKDGSYLYIGESKQIYQRIVEHTKITSSKTLLQNSNHYRSA